MHQALGAAYNLSMINRSQLNKAWKGFLDAATNMIVNTRILSKRDVGLEAKDKKPKDGNGPNTNKRGIVKPIHEAGDALTPPGDSPVSVNKYPVIGL